MNVVCQLAAKPCQAVVRFDLVWWELECDWEEKTKLNNKMVKSYTYFQSQGYVKKKKRKKKKPTIVVSLVFIIKKMCLVVETIQR